MLKQYLLCVYSKACDNTCSAFTRQHATRVLSLSLSLSRALSLFLCPSPTPSLLTFAALGATRTERSVLTRRGLDQGFQRGRAWEEYKRWAAQSARTRQDHVGVCLMYSRAARTHARCRVDCHVCVRVCDALLLCKNARTRTRLFPAHAVLSPPPPRLSHYTASISPVVCGRVYCVLRVLRVVQLFALAPL